MGPLVSFVMPVRDGGALLRPAVESVLSQTLPDLELLLVDDGSIDGAVAALSREDPRLRVIPSPGRGIVAALNAGVAACRGAFIARMDADDVSLPDRLAAQLGYLHENENIGVAGAGVRIVRDDGPVEEGFLRYAAWMNGLRDPGAIARELYVECPIAHPSALFRRAALERLGGYRDMPWAEDYDLFLRADRMGMRFGKPAGTHLLWRDRPGRVTRVDPRCGAGRFPAMKAHHLARSTRLRGPEAVVWGAGPTGKKFAAALEAEGVAVAAFLDPHPGRIGKTLRGAPVLAREAATEFRGTTIAVAVGARGAREEIRALAAGWGLAEGADFLFVA